MMKTVRIASISFLNPYISAHRRRYKNELRKILGMGLCYTRGLYQCNSVTKKLCVHMVWLPIILQMHRIKLSSNLATESLWPQCSDYLAGAPLSEWVRARMVAIKNVHAQTSLSSRRPHRMWMSKRDPKK